MKGKDAPVPCAAGAERQAEGRLPRYGTAYGKKNREDPFLAAFLTYVSSLAAPLPFFPIWCKVLTYIPHQAFLQT